MKHTFNETGFYMSFHRLCILRHKLFLYIFIMNNKVKNKEIFHETFFRPNETYFTVVNYTMSLRENLILYT